MGGRGINVNVDAIVGVISSGTLVHVGAFVRDGDSWMVGIVVHVGEGGMVAVSVIVAVLVAV